MPFVEMPHGPVNEVSGLVDVWFAPRLNSNVRSAATGSDERSGFGMSCAGTTLVSGYAHTVPTRNSRNRPTHGSGDAPEIACDTVRSFAGSLPSWCSQQFTR